MELFVEILCEEIPSRAQARAQKDFSDLWEKELRARKFKYRSLATFIGVRRIGLVVDNLEEFSDQVVEERRGPKIDAPDTAVQGFLKLTGLRLDELTQQNGYWLASVVKLGVSIAHALPEAFDRVVREMVWPTSMRWPGAEHTWIRPVRNVCCVYNRKPLEFYAKAFGLTTGGFTFGHRFLDPRAIAVTSFANYDKDLEASKVVVDAARRERMIVERLTETLEERGLAYLPDEALLSEVTGLVEYPYVGLGAIEEKFMKLPNAVLSTAMRVHQKYFTVLNKDGSHAPYFAFVANVPVNGEMSKGYEKVLRARLSDALFFFERDLKTDLSERAEALKNMTFHERLGSVFDKVKRLEFLAPDESSKAAAKLCKADLLTLMVEEFPELQGVMGEIYAKASGIDKKIATALASYHKPLGADDACPDDEIGGKLSLLDKFDTLVGFFGVGIKPSGSKDPYGLRRAALGIVRLALTKNAPYDLNEPIAGSIESYRLQGINLAPDTSVAVIRFITERLANFLKNDMPADRVYAVLDRPLTDIRVTVKKAEALVELLRTDEGKALRAAYVRVDGILKREPEQGSVDESLLTEVAEKSLYETLEAIAPKINGAMETLDFVLAMKHLAGMKPVIDRFFDEVKVMDENLELRKNRLYLLRGLRKTMYAFADFSKLEG